VTENAAAEPQDLKSSAVRFVASVLFGWTGEAGLLHCSGF
jgi:hypothetical protein